MKLLKVLYFVLITNVLTAASTIYWDIQYPLTRSNLNSVVWTGEKFVAVGTDGTILTSPDGDNWSNTHYKSGANLSCAVFDGSRLIIGGPDSSILISKNYMDWTVKETGQLGFAKMIWDGKDLWALSGNKVLHSSDGNEWTSVTVFKNTYGDYYPDCIFSSSADSILVAVFNNNMLFTSKDGISWFQRILPSNVRYVSSGIWKDGKFIILGKSTSDSSFIATSSDGINWSSKNMNYGFLRDITYHGDTLIAIGDSGTIIISVDCNKWTLVDSGITNKNLMSLACSKSKTVAIGPNGTIISSSDSNSWNNFSSLSLPAMGIKYVGNTSIAIGANGTILTSDDGILWVIRKSGVAYNLSDVAYGDSIYVVVGNNGIVLKSKDLVSWDPSIADTSLPNFSNLTYQNNLFFAFTSGDEFWTSPDAKNWTRHNTGYTASGIIMYPSGKIIWNGKIFLSLAGDSVITSNDGNKWSTVCKLIFQTTGTRPFVQTDYPSDIVWNGKLFALLTTWGNVKLSADGVNWTDAEKPITMGYSDFHFFNKILWADSMFIAFAYNRGSWSNFSVSKDGNTWAGYEANVPFYSVTWTGDKLLATTDTYSAWKASSIYSLSNLPEAPSTHVISRITPSCLKRIKIINKILFADIPSPFSQNNIEYSILSLNGRILMNKKSVCRNSVINQDLHFLPKGIYVFYLKSNKNHLINRFVLN